MSLEQLLSPIFSPTGFPQGKDFYYVLSPREIHVWRANLNHQVDGFLHPLELRLAKNMGSTFVQKRFKDSRKILRSLLARYLDCSPEVIFFEKDHLGKPSVSKFPEISFSIAHSEEEMLFAFSRNLVGVDLELMRPVNFFAIAEKFFSSAEIIFLKKSNHEERFFQLWTAKEAALKADGLGITRGLRSAFSMIEKNRIAAIDLFHQRWSINLCHFTNSKNHFMAAVASSSVDDLVRWYDFN